MNRALLLLFAIGLAGLSPTASPAAQVTLDVVPGSSFSNRQATIWATVVNRGDAPASSVWMEIDVNGCRARTATHDALAAGGTVGLEATLPSLPDPPGAYVALLKVCYVDASGQSRSALSAIRLMTRAPERSGESVEIGVPAVSLASRGEVTVSFSTQEDRPVPIRARFRLSDDVECSPGELDVTIPAGGRCTTALALRNRRASPGNRYPLLVIADYERDGLHRSVRSGAQVSVVSPWSPGKLLAGAVSLVLAGAFAALQFAGVRRLLPRMPAWAAARREGFTALLLASLFGFLLYHIPPRLLLSDTLTVGGDTPAHHYLIDCLARSLRESGRIVSWAGGWWCGFPAFQYYFCLPYLLAVLFGLVCPANVAFKLVSVLGIFALPPAAYLAARRMRLPRPAPQLLAVAVVPLLFDHSHTMWGVNIYSTFAGMIANSVSFPLMLLFVASAWRDADEGRTRLRSVLCLTALIASHFFTTVMAVLLAATLPFLRPAAGFRRAAGVLAVEGLMGALLMAWWLVPLIAKSDYSMEFGVNWPMATVFKQTPSPAALALLAALVLAGAAAAFWRCPRAAMLLTCMLGGAAMLFAFGFDRVSPVFVNVRLWPFIVFSMLALIAVGAGAALADRPGADFAVAAVTVATLAFMIDRPNEVRAWAQWNFEGLEAKGLGRTFRALVDPLRGTPGRLANDLHEDNNGFGSTRIFECVPHLIGKPVLEGGIVNSALGSMFSYYVQGETSKQCAGFPTIVTPTSFNMEAATRHLELFNVKHFIARWPKTKQALSASEAWKPLHEAGGWKVFELTTHDGRYVVIPRREPIAVEAPDWKRDGLEWIYTLAAIDQPFVLLDPGEVTGSRFAERLGEADYVDTLRRARRGETNTLPAGAAVSAGGGVIEEEVRDGRIRFRTRAIGAPHLVKCTWFPNWKVRGAERVYRVTPCFLLVYPEREDVELYYGRTVSDNLGRAGSVAGLAILAAAAARRFSSKTRARPRDEDGSGDMPQGR